MTFGFGLDAGLRALQAARYGMQTAGNNVANANTAGYTRQRVELAAAYPFGVGGTMQIGAGVDIRSITRLVDEGIERRIQLQMGMVGAAQVDLSRMREIEGILGDPEGGLSASLTDLFGALDQLRTDPGDRALRGGLVQAGGALSQEFRMMASRLSDLSGTTFDEVRGLVRQVNDRAAVIASLNQQITAAEATGASANDLRDTRAQQVKELGKLIDVRALERANGSLDLLVGGHQLVAGDRTTALAVGKDAADSTKLLVGKADASASLKGGRIGALLAQEKAGVPGLQSRIDQLARNTILEWNRAHTTGMPASGPLRSLTSAYGAQDNDGDGNRGDELLSQAGLPFDISKGELYVNVTDIATGAIERTRIAIDPATMSLDDLATALNDIPNLTATVDPTGRLRLNAADRYGFDFSPRLDTAPDTRGTFGGMQPVLGSSQPGPYDLSDQTFPLSLVVNNGSAAGTTSTTVMIAATAFQDVENATADELATAINRQLDPNGTALVVGGRLVLQGSQNGSVATLSLASGTGPGDLLAALGLPTTTAIGRDAALEVTIGGAYTGAANQQFTFVPEGNGTIGMTQDLRMRVLDKEGNLVTTIDVGAGYEPGESIAVADGITVAFGAGQISGSQGQVFAVDALADSDTTDVLVALGLNSFFLGTSAADIAVNPELVANADRVAAGISAAAGDAGNLARLATLRDVDLDGLDGTSIEDFWSDLVGEVGFDVAAAGTALASQEALMAQLNAERESISGVNIDEEMVDMMRFQQSYEAAARFLAVAQEMTDTLINLGR
ncbi:MAG: flagellar hook-associated protein FlgK [Planctomycetes bacterium]|nr:flagellar hook-associated protein FlgK [Planctomycetota bacterium]